MIKAYIILAHKWPAQLLRLIKTLDDGFSSFFIHIDSEVDLEDFENIKILGDKIFFVERVSSRWSSFGLVQCTLNAMKSIKETNVHFDRVILLSGQDYPIKSNGYIDHFLKNSPHSIFLEYWSLPNHEKWPENRGGMYRVDKFFFGLEKHQLFYSRSLNFLGIVFPVLKRKAFMEMKPFAGSQWWILDMYALNYILDFNDRHPEYSNYHKYTFGPDELFFQMVLLNSKDDKILQSIQNKNKRFIRWGTTLASHPDILKKNDLKDIVQSDNLYARKFDIQIDDEILDLIDEQCLKIQFGVNR